MNLTVEKFEQWFAKANKLIVIIEEAVLHHINYRQRRVKKYATEATNLNWRTGKAKIWEMNKRAQIFNEMKRNSFKIRMEIRVTQIGCRTITKEYSIVRRSERIRIRCAENVIIRALENRCTGARVWSGWAHLRLGHFSLCRVHTVHTYWGE